MFLFKKILIDAIPALLFTFATIVISLTTSNRDIYVIVGFILYILGILSLDLHTYLINKINKKENDRH